MRRFKQPRVKRRREASDEVDQSVYQFIAPHRHDSLVSRQAGLPERSDLRVGDEPSVVEGIGVDQLINGKHGLEQNQALGLGP
jgi:hypothetical protein